MKELDRLAPAARPASEIAPGDTRMSEESNVVLVERYNWVSAVFGAESAPRFVTESATVPPPPATRLELMSDAVEIFNIRRTRRRGRRRRAHSYRRARQVA